MVLDVHERRLPVPIDRVAALLDSLGTEDDRLWPAERWPRLRCDGTKAVGTACGHGPVRYTLDVLDPGRTVVFRFTAPKGFQGTHGFTLTPDGADACILRHTLVLKPKGRARLAWPFFFRPLHDALIEDALDKAEHATGTGPAVPASWSRRVRALRRLALLHRRK